jgi:hypothetical protein
MPVVVACGWLLANNILEVMLFYMMVMPGGLLQRLAHTIAARPQTLQPPQRQGTLQHA